jgi:hypothetical protein
MLVGQVGVRSSPGTYGQTEEMSLLLFGFFITEISHLLTGARCSTPFLGTEVIIIREVSLSLESLGTRLDQFKSH